METNKMSKIIYCAAILLGVAAVLLAAPILARGTAHEEKSQAPNPMAQTECTFSDGSTIAFGRRTRGARLKGGWLNSWREGDYEATTFRVSERMLIPPMDSPIEIPAGSYTVFVRDKSDPPWTLIGSKKTGEWGMPYPGEQDDLERTCLGSDVAAPVENFNIGCMQHENAPMFLWMQSGSHVAYAKIMAVETQGWKGRVPRALGQLES